MSTQPNSSVSGQILEKTTRTRVIQENEIPDFWTYIEQQTLPDAKHILYLYLVRDNKSIPYGVYSSHFPLRDGRVVPIYDREAFEQGIQSRFGGGVWRLILKCGSQKRTEARVFTGDGPTQPPPVETEHQPNLQGAKPFIQPTAADTTAQIASQAIETIAGQEHRAINLGLEMVRTAADTVKRYADHSGQPASGVAAELENEFKRAMIARMTQDPMAQLSQMLTLMRELNGNRDGNGLNLDGLRGVISFARELGLMGGAAAAGGPSSAGVEIVRTVTSIIPGAVDAFRATMEAWSAGKQAERDTAVIMSQPPGRPVMTNAVPVAPRSPFTPQTPPLPSAAAPNPSQPSPGAIVPPSTEFIEQRIVEIFRAPIPAEEAASRTLEFLHTLDGENPKASYVTLLANLGETGLVNTFHMRPLLKPATADMVRLLEFIRAFLRMHAEDLSEEATEQHTKPN